MRNTPKRQHSNAHFEIQDTFRLKVGAVVVKRMENAWYFGYFHSLTRPYRGLQVVRGNVDPNEDIYEAVDREIREEYGRPARVLEKFLVNHHYADGDLVDLQIFFLAEDMGDATPKTVWRVVDGDEDAQELEWRFARLDGDISFMGRGQTAVVEAARRKLLS